MNEDSQEDRREKCRGRGIMNGDQIEVFKITHGIEGSDSDMSFQYKTDNRTRGHRWALIEERV